MKLHTAVFGLLLAWPSSCLPAPAQITRVQILGLTPTQAIISYQAPDSNRCILAVSEGTTYWPVVADVDTAKFPGASSDIRFSFLDQGLVRYFVAGTVPKPSGAIFNLAVDSGFYGRALRPNTRHYFKITCGTSTARGTFATPNLPLGKTYGEPAPIIGGTSNWQANTSYSPGNLILDSNGYIEQAQGPGTGTSGGSAPRWEAPGSNTIDNSVIWKNLGTMWSYPSIFTAAQWSTSNPHAYQLRDPDTGLPIQFVTEPADYTSDFTNHAFAAMGTCNNWANATNLLSESGFAKVTTSDKCAVIQGNTSFIIPSIYFTDAVELIVSAFSTVSGDKLDVCMTLDGVTCVAPARQFSLIRKKATYCFPQTTACGTTPRPNPWSSDWNAPLAPVLANTITASTQQKPGTTGISRNSNFGFLIWKDPSATGTISAQNVKANILTSMHVGGGFPNGGQEWMCNHNSISDQNGVAGYLCMEGYAGGRMTLFWINSVNGEVRNLGEFNLTGLANFANGANQAPPTETFDVYVPNVAYFTAKDNSRAHKWHIVKCILPASGNRTYNSSAAPNASAPCTWVDLTPDNPPTSYTLQDQIANFDSRYSAAKFPPGSAEGTSGYNGHTYFTWAALMGNQDSPAWMGAFDVNSSNPGRSGVVAAAPTFLDSLPHNVNGQVGCRWCGWHTVHNPGDTHWLVWAPHTASAQVIGGGFGTDITAGTLNAHLDTSSLTFQVDTTRNFLQDIAAGDWLGIDIMTANAECVQVAAVTRKGATPPYSYSVTVVSRNNSMNGQCGGGLHSHIAGATIQMMCYAVTQFWWDFLSDPHARTNMFTNTDNMYSHYAYTAAGTGNVVFGNGISETRGWSTCWNYDPGANCPGGAAVTVSHPSFSGVTVDTSGNTYEKHPTSVHQIKAAGNDLLWGGDIATSSVNNQANPVSLALVSGNLYSFTPGSSQLYKYNYKKLATLAIAGFHPLLDVSGPSSIIDGTTASSYEWCYAYRANECVRGSIAGSVYANAPYFTTASFCGSGSFPANGYAAHTESQLCFTNYPAYAESVTQIEIDKADSTGANSRSVGIGMTRFGFRSGYANPQPDPSGRWMFIPVYDVNGRADVFEINVPPFPGTNTISRNDFVQVRLDSGTPPPNTSTALLEFGYDANFYCTSRTEECVAVSTRYNQANPFYYETSDSYKRASCVGGCKLVLPLIPSHVVYYRWKFYNSGGTLISVGNTLVSGDPTFQPESTPAEDPSTH